MVVDPVGADVIAFEVQVQRCLEFAGVGHAAGKGALTPAGQEVGIDCQQVPPRHQDALGIGLEVGPPGGEVEAIMRRDMHSTVQRHAKSTNVLRKLGEFAPAMGLIGTLIGLVQMLGRLNDPSTIGPSMAVALLTTFYGAVLANIVFLPLAAKLERNSTEEALVNNVYLMGATSIGRQENPRRLEMLLNSLLPPSQRVQYFD